MDRLKLGLLLGLPTQTIFPLLGRAVLIGNNVLIAVIFAAVPIVRGFSLRHPFDSAQRDCGVRQP